MKNWKNFPGFKAAVGFLDRISWAIRDRFIRAEPRLTLYERIDHMDLANMVNFLFSWQIYNRIMVFPYGSRRLKLSPAPVTVKGVIWTPLTTYYWQKAISNCARKL
jgi:hypothetical protein